MDLEIDKGIIKAFMLLVTLVALIGIGFVVQFVYLVMTGSIFQTAAAGNLPITNGTNNSLTAAETDMNTVFGYVRTGYLIAGGLISVAVIILIFIGFVKYGKGMLGGGKGSGGAY